MEALKQYILSVSAAAILCGLVAAMMPKGSMQGILKLVCGVFLAVLILEPVTRLDPGKLFSYITGDLSTEGEAAAAFGEEIARDSMSEYIKRETEAYILDKAHDLGITAEVEVTVGKDDLPVPAGAVIYGHIPEPLRREMEQLIEHDLGISRENLQWIGQR